MASFAMEDFVGSGLLKPFLPKLLEEGWDDVPTLKLMNSEDMDDLHDRALMQYADKMEVTGKSITELLSFSTVELSTVFAMKRGHIARFMNKTTVCGSSLSPAPYSIPARRRSMSKSELSTDSRSNSITMSELSSNEFRRSLKIAKPLARNLTMEQSISDLKIKDGYVFKGVVASMPAEARACGCVQPPPVIDEVAPYSPTKALEIWRDRPAVLVCIRRPGYMFPSYIIFFFFKMQT